MSLATTWVEQYEARPTTTIAADGVRERLVAAVTNEGECRLTIGDGTPITITAAQMVLLSTWGTTTFV